MPHSAKYPTTFLPPTAETELELLDIGVLDFELANVLTAELATELFTEVAPELAAELFIELELTAAELTTAELATEEPVPQAPLLTHTS